MIFSALIERQFKSIFKWSAVIGICSLVGFGSLWIFQTRHRAKTFIISQVRETAVAGINSQTMVTLDGELNRIIGLWSSTEDFPVRVNVSLDGKRWAHGGQLHTFSWPFTTDEYVEHLPSGQKLVIDVETDIGTPLTRIGLTLLLFAIFFGVVFVILYNRVRRSVKDVTSPLEARIKKIKEISDNLADLREVVLDQTSGNIGEVQALDSSLKQLVDRILKLEADLRNIHFTEGRINAAEQLAHTMKGTVANFQLTLKSPTLSNKDREELGVILQEFRTISEDVLKAKKKPEEPSPINVSDVVRNLIEFKKTEIKKRNPKSAIHFEFIDSSEGVDTVCGPVGAFERSVSDILTNAVEALEVGGMVTVRIRSSEKALQLEIQDNGRGIPAEVISTLMNKGVTFGKKGGTGLGLYHARLTFEDMGGNLNIFSGGVGKGATITAALPPKQDSQELYKILLFPGQTIVIVDDDVSVHRFFEKKLLPYKTFVDVVKISSPKDFQKWISKNHEFQGVRQYFFDVEFDGSDVSGLGLIEAHKLHHESVIISGIADKSEIITEARRLKVPLMHKNHLNQIEFKLENNEEQCEELIS